MQKSMKLVPAISKHVVIFNPIPPPEDICRAATSIGNTDFLSVTDFFAQKRGKPNIFRYFSWYFYR